MPKFVGCLIGFSVLARGEFGWRKVWQGQVYRQFFFAGLPPR
nr:hypothetical protein [uncultured Vibrio sp.]